MEAPELGLAREEWAFLSLAFSKSVKVDELSAKWPPNALLALDLSMSSSEQASAVDPAKYETDVNGQLHNEYCIPSFRNAIIAPGGGRDCLALNYVTPLASFNHSTELGTSSSLTLPWLYEENDQRLIVGCLLIRKSTIAFSARLGPGFMQ